MSMSEDTCITHRGNIETCCFHWHIESSLPNINVDKRKQKENIEVTYVIVFHPIWFELWDYEWVHTIGSAGLSIFITVDDRVCGCVLCYDTFLGCNGKAWSKTESLIKFFYHTSPGLLLQVQTGLNPSKCIQYIFYYFEPQTEHQVRCLPLPKLMTKLRSHPSRFWFKPEFRTELQKH